MSLVPVFGLALALCGPAHAEPLSRTALVDAVLADSPELQAADHGVRAAQARPRQVGALPDPRLAYGIAPGTLLHADHPLGQTVELSQALPFPGTNRPRAEAAEDRAMAMALDVQDLRHERVSQALRHYDELAWTDRALALLAQHRTLLTALQAAADAGYAAGRSGAWDPIYAEVELAHLEHLQIRLEADRVEHSAALGALLHRSGAAFEVEPLAAPPALPESPATDHPRLAADAARTDAAEDDLLAARRATRPDLAVRGQYSSMWPSAAHQWMVGLGVEIPLTMGARRASIDEAGARQAATQAAAATTSDQLAAEQQTLRARYSESRQVAALYADRVVPAARTRLDVIRTGFESGAVDFRTVIEAERGLREAELQQARALADAWTRLAMLQRASGSMPGLPTPEGNTP